ncbi:hypothetical protein Asppvi_010705 [Aspergillus pseudoviridinutans]|uniref:Ankyrin repeat-containing domain protein n=1 Tax=Aspergillus pseudoviridinutans TaxID=1517512 RepID=A0A9P3F074_9EURO|nr:uncharacterized protein Asppvi_010705 [Aspergillus pseudoviridinutans]GIJ91733.1 hypothetical protein Asppvi_010705 [Aspergillus pseudoviridinutans]
MRTVLHWAIKSRDSDLMDLMIHYKAPLDPAGDGMNALSALGVAVISQDISIILRLLEAGAQPGQEEDPCPIARAIETRQLQVIELLIERARQNDKVLLQRFIDYGLDLSLDGHTALFTAIMYGQYGMVEFLIEKGADPHLMCELRLDDGHCLESSIGFAIYFRHLHILKLLLAKGVVPAQYDLSLAAKKEFEEAVALLSKFSNQELPPKETLERYMCSQRYLEREKVVNFKLRRQCFFVAYSTSPEEPEKPRPVLETFLVQY